MKRKRHRWTPEEDRCIKLSYACTRTAVLAKHLRLRQHQIHRRASWFGVVKTFVRSYPHWSLYEQILLQECERMEIDFLPALGKSRVRLYVLARARTYNRLRCDDYSLTGIGRAAGMHHTSVLASLRRLQGLERWFVHEWKKPRKKPKPRYISKPKRMAAAPELTAPKAVLESSIRLPSLAQLMGGR